MEVSGQLHAPTPLLTEKQPHWIGGWMGSQIRSGHCGRNVLPLPGIVSRLFCCSIRIGVSILTELFLFFYSILGLFKSSLNQYLKYLGLWMICWTEIQVGDMVSLGISAACVERRITSETCCLLGYQQHVLNVGDMSLGISAALFWKYSFSDCILKALISQLCSENINFATLFWEH
jgi:hypothetical protein